MKFFENLVSTFQGNLKTKLNDPFIGAFIFSFFVWNWSASALLIFGNTKVEDRITAFVQEMAPPTTSFTDFLLGLFVVYLLPFLFACFYVFVMPWISIWVAKKVSKAEIAKHVTAVDVELKQIKKQRELNEEKLLNDPKKPFLEEALKEKIKKERLLAEDAKSKADKAKSEAEQAEAENQEAQARRDSAEAERKVNQAKANAEEDRQERMSVIEKNKIMVSTSETKAMLQANAHATCFNFVRMLSKSLAEDDISLTVDSLTEITAAIFGYDSFGDLLNDETFNNRELAALEYIVSDPQYLGRRLEEILTNDHISPEQCSSDDVFSYIDLMFEELPYTYAEADSIAETVFESCADNSFDLINEDGFSAAIAETDTIIDDISFNEYNSELTASALELEITGSASGSHRKESDVMGQGISFVLKVILPIKWGRFALAEKECELKATPEYDQDYYEEADSATD